MKKSLTKGPNPWFSGEHGLFLFVFSFIINALGLVGAIYMMQVYDRVLSSGSIPTLISISIIAGGLYLLHGALDYVRTNFLIARGERFSSAYAPKAFRAAIDAHVHNSADADARQSIDDLRTIRSFITSKGYSSFYDVMWMPIFLLFIFGLHPMLGMTALGAAVFLIIMAFINESVSRKRVKAESEKQGKSRQWAAQIHRSAPVITANGMDAAMAQRWLAQEQEIREESMSFQALSSKFTGITRTVRLMVQSAILGVGAYYAVKGIISPGAMIAASIVFGKTLSPVEQLLGRFPAFIRARQSWSRMKTWKDMDLSDTRMALPMPSKSLVAKFNTLTPPAGQNPVLKSVHLKLEAGDVLGVIGESGGGKSSLAKALANAWPVAGGGIVLDGADYNDWPRSQLGHIIGYMAQDCQLFDGTVAENIAGFNPQADERSVFQASMTAGAHDMILGLAQGYNTPVGPNGVPLSAGQRQRLNFARALYGNPFVVVLDEPNSNLDDKGEAALAAAIQTLSSQGKIVIVVAHRQKVLEHVNKLCVIENGAMKLSGPKQGVLDHMNKTEGKASTPSAPAKPKVGNLQKVLAAKQAASMDAMSGAEQLKAIAAQLKSQPSPNTSRPAMTTAQAPQALQNTQPVSQVTAVPQAQPQSQMTQPLGRIEPVQLPAHLASQISTQGNLAVAMPAAVPVSAPVEQAIPLEVMDRRSQPRENVNYDQMEDKALAKKLKRQADKAAKKAHAAEKRRLQAEAKQAAKAEKLRQKEQANAAKMQARAAKLHAKQQAKAAKAAAKAAARAGKSNKSKKAKTKAKSAPQLDALIKPRQSQPQRFIDPSKGGTPHV